MSKKNEWREGYKVVLASWSGELISAIMDKRDGGCVTYRPGEIATPCLGCGPLCVFTSYEAAANFCGESEQIWRCQYKPSDKTEAWIKFRSWIRPINFMPDGTALADAVILTEKVRDDEIKKQWMKYEPRLQFA